MLLKVFHSIRQQIWKIQQWPQIGKGQFSFQFQRRAMPKNVQTTTELHSFHMLVKLFSKSFKLGFSSIRTENFLMYKLDLEKAEEPEMKLPTFTGSQKAREFQKNIYFCFTDYKKTLTMDHNKLENFWRDGNNKSPYVSSEKPVCGSRSMKCSRAISSFLEKIPRLSHSVVFLYIFALFIEEGLLISPGYSLELYI